MRRRSLRGRTGTRDPVPAASGTINLVGGDGSAWQVDPATAELREVVPASGSMLPAEHTLSPDGSRIASVRYSDSDMSADLYLADADGGNERMLAEDASIPAWSPDGQLIAYISLDPFSGGASLHVVPAGGGEPVELAEDAGPPRWSPDGKRLAFMSAEMGSALQPTFPPAELRVINADGSGLQTLAEGSPFADRPAWSPDGTRIAFSAGSETDGRIDVIDLASGDVATLAEADGGMAEPTWAPDGQRIAFVISSASIFSFEAVVGIVAAEGGDIERYATDTPGYLANPTWSPDGAWLAVSRADETTLSSDMVVIAIPSGEEVVLATNVFTVMDWRE